MYCSHMCGRVIVVSLCVFLSVSLSLFVNKFSCKLWLLEYQTWRYSEAALVLGTVNVGSRKLIVEGNRQITNFCEQCLLWMINMDMLTSSIRNSVIVRVLSCMQTYIHLKVHIN